MFVFQEEGALRSKCWANNCLIEFILILHVTQKRKIQEVVVGLHIFRIFQND